jgi:hypothetical protein
MNEMEKMMKGLTKEDLEKAKKSGGESLIKNLDKNSLKILNELLKDKEKTQKILSSPEAKKLFEMFNKGEK